MKHISIFLLCIFCSLVSFAQELQWFDPAQSQVPVIQGRGWQKGLDQPYDRLPARAKKDVREEVWGLSKNTAGEYITFKTKAPVITVRYQITGGKAMDHMPATGVSGVDLYGLDEKNQWHWVRGEFSFSDTVSFVFQNIYTAVPIKEYRLYLPLYNTPKWLQIGVEKKSGLTFTPASTKRAMVLYGTSIMQGACASRAGLAWTNILGRRFDQPIINLGFSGNGRLEEPLINLINEQKDVSLFVLDCMPNLSDWEYYSASEIEKRINNSVASLRDKNPSVPILLVEHSCGTMNVSTDSSFINRYTWGSKILTKTYQSLVKSGMKNLYLLTAAEIGMDSESTVDGTHPTDIGMQQHADAYEKKIREIFKHSQPATARKTKS